MLDHLWHLRGSAPIDPAVSDSDALDRIAALLAHDRKPVTRRGAQSIVFDSPLWRNLTGPNWLALVIYDRGRLWIDADTHDRRLRYDLRSLHGFVFCLFAAAMFFTVGLAKRGDAGDGATYAAFAFGWLYGMNMLLAWYRIPRKIRTSVGATEPVG